MTQPRFYIGLDVHKDSTTYVVREQRGSVVVEGECATQYKDLKSVLGPYLISAKVALEASTSYYKLYSGFKGEGVDIAVANTLQLRQLVAKSDPLDARRLSDMLRLGTMPESFIPGEDIQRLRSIVHIRQGLVEEKVRWKNRIQALLDMEGISLSCWGGAFTQKWIAAFEQYLASPTANEMVRHAHTQYRGVETHEGEVSELMIAATRERWAEEHTLLQSIPGIGPKLACVCIAEIWPISRFASEKKLRRYAGVVPVVKQSGEHVGKSKLPKKSRRRLLCLALVQAANAAGRTRTNLGNYYRRKKKQKKIAGKAKMAVASTISDIVYKVLTTRSPYVPKAN